MKKLAVLLALAIGLSACDKAEGPDSEKYKPQLYLKKEIWKYVTGGVTEGVIREFDYDQTRKRPVKIRVINFKTGNLQAEYTFTYNQSSQITAVNKTEPGNAPSSWAITYDNAGRITQTAYTDAGEPGSGYTGTYVYTNNVITETINRGNGNDVYKVHYLFSGSNLSVVTFLEGTYKERTTYSSYDDRKSPYANLPAGTFGYSTFMDMEPVAFNRNNYGKKTAQNPGQPDQVTNFVNTCNPEGYLIKRAAENMENTLLFEYVEF